MTIGICNICVVFSQFFDCCECACFLVNENRNLCVKKDITASNVLIAGKINSVRNNCYSVHDDEFMSERMIPGIQY